MRTITINSKGKQSNSGWNRTGCGNWWAAYDVDGRRVFLTIPYTRGDRNLVATVEIPETVTEIHIGAGKAGRGKSCDAHRETITIQPESV